MLVPLIEMMMQQEAPVVEEPESRFIGGGTSVQWSTDRRRFFRQEYTATAGLVLPVSQSYSAFGKIQKRLDLEFLVQSKLQKKYSSEINATALLQKSLSQPILLFASRSFSQSVPISPILREYLQTIQFKINSKDPEVYIRMIDLMDEFEQNT